MKSLVEYQEVMEKTWIIFRHFVILPVYEQVRVKGKNNEVLTLETVNLYTELYI